MTNVERLMRLAVKGVEPLINGEDIFDDAMCTQISTLHLVAEMNEKGRASGSHTYMYQL